MNIDSVGYCSRPYNATILYVVMYSLWKITLFSVAAGWASFWGGIWPLTHFGTLAGSLNRFGLIIFLNLWIYDKSHLSDCIYISHLLIDIRMSMSV